MINSTNNAVQTVADGANVLFNVDRVRTNSCKSCCDGWLCHDSGSGIFTITKPGIYLVRYSSNVANPTTAGEITMNISSSGESITGGEMIATPTAVEAYFNIAASILVKVCQGSSAVVTIKNNSGADVLVSAPSIVITREC